MDTIVYSDELQAMIIIIGFYAVGAISTLIEHRLTDSIYPDDPEDELER